MNDLISVVVPVYKVEMYLDRCIKSIVNQTYKNLEIILVDDGSPDKSPKMCDEWCKKDKRIKVIHKENGGLSDARNVGIDIAKGKYITFVDSDDWLPKNAIYLLYSAIYLTEATICSGKSLNVYDETKSFDMSTSNILTAYDNIDAMEKLMYLHDFSNSAWAKLYKKDLFRNIRYPKGKYYEDLATTYKLFSISDEIIYIDDVVYFYFQNNEGIMHKKYTSKRLEGLDFALEELHFIEKKYNAIINAAIYRLFYECLSILNDMPYFCKDKKEVLKYIKKYQSVVLHDKKISTKQRLLCISSYMGSPGIKLAFFCKAKIKQIRK